MLKVYWFPLIKYFISLLKEMNFIDNIYGSTLFANVPFWDARHKSILRYSIFKLFLMDSQISNDQIVY